MNFKRWLNSQCESEANFFAPQVRTYLTFRCVLYERFIITVSPILPETMEKNLLVIGSFNY